MVAADDDVVRLLAVLHAVQRVSCDEILSGYQETALGDPAQEGCMCAIRW